MAPFLFISELPSYSVWMGCIESTMESQSWIACSFVIAVFVGEPSSSGCAESSVSAMRGDVFPGRSLIVSNANFSVFVSSPTLSFAQPSHS